jgi:hypothetical protein
MSNCSWAQIGSLNDEVEINCPSQPLPVDLDSSARQIALDSVMNRISGRWQLIQIHGGWSKAHKPYWSTEMILNRQGQGIIYENGKLTLTYKLVLSTSWNYVRCAIIGESKPFFRLNSRAKGIIRLCDQILTIDQNLGDGEVFVFSRLDMGGK